MIVVSHVDKLKSHRVLERGPCFDRIGSHLMCVHVINRWRGSQIGIGKHALPPDADVAADATSDLAELTAASNRILGADSASTGVDDLALLVWKQIVALVTRCPLRELQDRGHKFSLLPGAHIVSDAMRSDVLVCGSLGSELHRTSEGSF